MVDFEGAANYSSPTNPGMVKYKEFHTTFKRSLSGRTRAKHDEVMRRPAVKAQWDLADSAQRLYMADLEVYKPNNQIQIQIKHRVLCAFEQIQANKAKSNIGFFV